MTFTKSDRRATVLSSSKTRGLPGESTSRGDSWRRRFMRRPQISADDMLLAAATGLMAAVGEAGNVAVNGVSDLPWPGLLQISAGYLAFVALLVWSAMGLTGGNDG